MRERFRLREREKENKNSRGKEGRKELVYKSDLGIA